MNEQRSDVFIFEAPKVAGAYWLGGINCGLAINLPRKPNWWHRLMMHWAFGWQWVDDERS